MNLLNKSTILPFISVILLATSPISYAGLITTSLGNTASGLSDGDTPSVIPELVNIQSGQSAPFNAGIGSDLFGSDVVGWQFNYAAIIDVIIGATLTIGIADHDSMSTGSQVNAFSGDGLDLTSELDTLFEGHGGSDGEYNIYTIVLSNSFFADLADGSFLTSLDIGGSGLQTALPFLGGGVSETTNNGFHLVYSTLSITTDDTGTGPGPNPIPEPSTLMLFGLALLVSFKKIVNKNKT